MKVCYFLGGIGEPKLDLKKYIIKKFEENL